MKKSRKNQILIELISNSRKDINNGCFNIVLKDAISEKYSNRCVSTFPEPVVERMFEFASKSFLELLGGIFSLFVADHASIAFRSK